MADAALSGNSTSASAVLGEINYEQRVGNAFRNHGDYTSPNVTGETSVHGKKRIWQLHASMNLYLLRMMSCLLRFN